MKSYYASAVAGATLFFAATCGIALARDADTDWAQLEQIVSDIYANNSLPQDRLSYLRRSEDMFISYRKLGSQFCGRYPGDQRCWKWLKATMQLAKPRYFKSAEQAAAVKYDFEMDLDEPARKAWYKHYYTQLKPAYLGDPALSNELRQEIYEAELADRFSGNRTGGLDQNLLRGLFDFGSRFPRADAKYFAGTLIYNADSWKLDETLKDELIGNMKSSPNDSLRELGAGWQRLEALRKEPLRFTSGALTGDEIDLAQQAGKVVLLDVWSLSCSTCIESMPKVEAMYKKYQSSGLKVIGVWLTGDAASERSKALGVLAKQGVTWGNAELAGKTMEEFLARYAITAVPTTLLIDKKGLLVAVNVGHEELESQITRLLR